MSKRRKNFNPNFNPFNKYSYSNIENFIKDITNSYKNENEVECFVIVHGIIEMVMNSLWDIFLMKKLGKVMQIKNKDFNICVELLYETEVINKNLESLLLSFKRGRNLAVHRFGPRSKKSQVHEKVLFNQFKEGLRAYKRLRKIRSNMTRITLKM